MLRTQLARMPVAMKADVAPHPLLVRAFRAKTVVTCPDDLPELLEQARWVFGGWSRICRMRCRIRHCRYQEKVTTITTAFKHLQLTVYAPEGRMQVLSITVGGLSSELLDKTST